MPIVTKKSDLFRDEQAGGEVLDAAKTKGRMFTAHGTATNAADDLSGSKYHLIDLPSGAILDDRTAFDVEATGFAAIRIGTKDDVDALVSQTKATENIVTPLAFGDANHGKALWEILGMAEDPGGFIGLYQHAIANATGAGTMLFRISWNA
mgnify:CR=1 FL=1